MPRYFVEVAYQGTRYSGFQIQQNSNTIQSEIEKALEIFFKVTLRLTGASRTDTGVHALQNFFHFDALYSLPFHGSSIIGEISGEADRPGYLETALYSLNAILPYDIVIKSIVPVIENAHCRFDAIERRYTYFIYRKKDAFLRDRAYFYPYKLQLGPLQTGAAIIGNQQDFTSFSKRSTQVKNFMCSIHESFWTQEENILIYSIAGNRFLRGMVRGLVATMLKLGRGLITVEEFYKIFKAVDCAQGDFSAPPQGLFLNHVLYPPNIFK